MLGFAGIQFSRDGLIINPKLPKAWNSMSFTIKIYGNRIKIEVSKEHIKVQREDKEIKELKIQVEGKDYWMTENSIEIDRGRD